MEPEQEKKFRVLPRLTVICLLLIGCLLVPFAVSKYVTAASGGDGASVARFLGGTVEMRDMIPPKATLDYRTDVGTYAFLVIFNVRFEPCQVARSYTLELTLPQDGQQKFTCIPADQYFTLQQGSEEPLKIYTPDQVYYDREYDEHNWMTGKSAFSGGTCYWEIQQASGENVRLISSADKKLVFEYDVTNGFSDALTHTYGVIVFTANTAENVVLEDIDVAYSLVCEQVD